MCKFTDGKFTVGALKLLLLGTNMFAAPTSPGAIVTKWCKLIPAKVNIFFWKASNCKLPTKSNLAKKGVVLPCYSCTFCNSCDEDESHLLLRCNFTRKVWDHVVKWLNLPGGYSMDWRTFCTFIPSACEISLGFGLFYKGWDFGVYGSQETKSYFIRVPRMLGLYLMKFRLVVSLGLMEGATIFMVIGTVG